MLEDCLELRRGLGNELDIASTLSTLSFSRLRGGDTTGAEEGEQEALKIFRSLGDRYCEGIGLLHLGQIALRAEKEDDARAYLKECLAVAQKIKNKEMEGECLLTIGQLAFDAGEFAEAENEFKRSLTLCHEAADKRGEAGATRWLGRCDEQRGASEMAHSRLMSALNAYTSFELWEEVLECIEDIAALSAEREASKSARLLSAVERARDRLQLKRPAKSERRVQELLNRLRAALGDDDYARQWEQGKTLDIREAINQTQTPAGEPAFA
jgi:tetratricopeptide (TPR) repeat protein